MKLWGIGLLLVTSSVALSQSSLDKAKKSFSERDYAKASAYALAAVNENPKNSEAMIIAGDALMESNKLDSAMILYKSAEKLSPKNAAAVRKIGQLLSK